MYIAGTALLFLLVMIAMSMIFNHFFFSDTSDNGPVAPHPDENGTSIFPQDKQDVDSACGRSTFLQDDGALCQEACVPQFFKCCDPFDEFVLYNYTKKAVPVVSGLNGTDLIVVDLNATNLNATALNATDANATDANTAAPAAAPIMRTTSTDVEERNVTFLDGYDDFNMSSCSFDQEIRGCMSYAKCQALAGQIDPAPANLPDTCSFERLEQDEDACKTLCRKLDCCYAPYPDNCLAEKFDLCMDYAPCQNLRIYQDGISRDEILPTAPRELDFECAWGQPKCAEICDTASCCTNPGAESCFERNFMSCLTYSPCTANPDTFTNITIPPQFSHVEKPPPEFIYACNAKKEEVLEPSDKSCSEYCESASCCSAEGQENCFHMDPLGCVAWMAQCQTLFKEE
jgi:hypothetical protein